MVLLRLVMGLDSPPTTDELNARDLDNDNVLDLPGIVLLMRMPAF